MTEPTVCLTVDGQQVRCPAAWTIYQAATAVGIHIPTFCHHPKLVPVGACRTCLVEVEGTRTLQTSCSVPVQEGMVVRVHTSPTAVKARRAMIEFLLINHPLDCPVCDKGGECILQDQSMADGAGQSRYVEEKRHKSKRHPLGHRIVLDQERCVLCWRCIRFLDEWAGDHQLDLFGRGASTRLDTFPGRPLTSQWQGNTIDLCPVGALTSRAFRFEARVWELTNTPTVCTLCPVGCSTTLGVKNNELRRITPRENMLVNDAWICDRGRFSHALVNPLDRLTRPLIRRDGKLEAATWDEALDTIARRFDGILQEMGPGAIAGLGSTRATNEANYLLQRFMRAVVGTNNVDHLGRVPPWASPLSSLPDLEQKDVILLLGFDPSIEAPLVELWLKKAILRHRAQVVVAHPLPIELTRYGGLWLSVRPGSEASLLNGLARAILDVRAVEALAGARATNLDEFRTWVQDYTPEEVERSTAVPAGTLKAAAQSLAQAKRPIILYGRGWLSGAANVWAPLANLSQLVGNAELGFISGDCNSLGAREMGAVPDLLPGAQPLDDGRVRGHLASLWGAKLASEPGLDLEGMLAAAQGEHLGAAWVLEANPVAHCPGAGDALAKVPFLVAQDLVATETTALAEVVLPAATLAESDGTLINLTGRLQVLRPAKRSPGQAWPAWRIVAEVAHRMLDAKRQKVWEFSSAAGVFAEISKIVPAYRGLTLDTIPEEGFQPIREPAGPTKAARRSFVRSGVESTDHGPQFAVDGPSSIACRPSPKPGSDERNR